MKPYNIGYYLGNFPSLSMTLWAIYYFEISRGMVECTKRVDTRYNQYFARVDIPYNLSFPGLTPFTMFLPWLTPLQPVFSGLTPLTIGFFQGYYPLQLVFIGLIPLAICLFSRVDTPYNLVFSRVDTPYN